MARLSCKKKKDELLKEELKEKLEQTAWDRRVMSIESLWKHRVKPKPDLDQYDRM